MELKCLTLSELRNGEHYQLQTDITELIEKAGPDKLGIQAVFEAFKLNFEKESIAFRKVTKSAVTDDLAIADMTREQTLKGTTEVVHSACRHFNPIVQEAGKRIRVRFDHYGDLTNLSYDEETAGIHKLTKDLTDSFTGDMATIGISDWIEHLKLNNEAFVALKNSRYTEDSSKTHLAMKDVRQLVDKTFNAMTKRLAALMLVNGENGYIEFVNEYNSRIESYKRMLDQRKGRNNKDNPPDTDGKE